MTDDRTGDSPASAGQLYERVVNALLHERQDELTKEACDRCENCGPMVMCAFHSVLSVLTGHTSIQDANGEWLPSLPSTGKETS